MTNTPPKITSLAQADELFYLAELATATFPEQADYWAARKGEAQRFVSETLISWALDAQVA